MDFFKRFCCSPSIALYDGWRYRPRLDCLDGLDAMIDVDDTRMSSLTHPHRPSHPASFDFSIRTKKYIRFFGTADPDPTSLAHNMHLRPTPSKVRCTKWSGLICSRSPSYNFFRNNWARISRLERCSQRISSHSCQLSISILTNKWEQGICKEPHKRINGNCFNARSSVGHLRLMCFISIWSFLALKTDACLNYEDCSH